MAEHQWAPPEHPDVTLHQPIGFDPELAGPLTAIAPPQPVWADIAFEQIPGTLHLKCFAIASSEVAVLVTPIRGLLGAVSARLAVPAAAVASISYGIYVLHYPLLVRSDAAGTWWLVPFIILTIALAWVSDVGISRILPRAPRT